MIVHFSKYHGTGNDFIMLDGRDQDVTPFNSIIISEVCHRRLGVGADGLIILENSSMADFRMRYYNSDGREGTMCGNGGRCITRFAEHLGLIGKETTFEGIDGPHRATILADNNISLLLKDVNGIRMLEDGYLLDTGSPHFIQFVNDLDSIDVENLGREIRHQSRFGSDGVNVNFVYAGSGRSDRFSGEISVRTYERGVEAETLSCGTGVTAAAICTAMHLQSDILTFAVNTRGGTLRVSFRDTTHNSFTDVTLTGPAVKVFEGTLQV
ncbi:MAG: diaminopimelate epimerase [Bacteroidales bacterium]